MVRYQRCTRSILRSFPIFVPRIHQITAMIYFKLVIASAFLFQLVLANRNVKPGCGFGRFFGCFRPQVLEKEAIEPVEEFFNAVESDTGAIVEPSNSDTKTTRSEEYFDAESDNYPTPESSTIQNQPDQTPQTKNPVAPVCS